MSPPPSNTGPEPETGSETGPGTGPGTKSGMGRSAYDGGQPPPDDATVTAPRRVLLTAGDRARESSGRHAVPDTTLDTTLDTASDRGSLTIADEVVEKIAGAAAGEVEHVGGAARRVLGMTATRQDGSGPPRVSARVVGEIAALDVRLSVHYPASVRAVTEEVRARLRNRVQALTGLTVSRVDVSVAALTRDTPTSRRVVS